jgi:serine/threonine-protein kinase PpkA
MIAICRSLGFAHNHGVIHRDIKPQNIMFRDDNIPVLTDFGIAQLMNSDPRLTIPGRTIGSPLYMSPEQICGRMINERADLYAIGILFYEMLTNQLPYHSDQFVDIALMHKTAPIPVLPDELSVFQPLLEKMLAKEPDNRYASAQELINALEQIDSENALPDKDAAIKLFSAERQVRRLDGGKLHNIVRRGDPVADATQPTIEPLDGCHGATPNSDPETHQTQHPMRSIRKKNLPVTGPQKQFAMWKKGAVAAVALLAVSGGILFYLSISTSSFISTAISTQITPAPSPPADDESSRRIGLYANQVGSDQHKQILSVQAQNKLPVPLQKSTVEPQSVDQKIAELLAKAQTQLANYRLSSPLGDNCYETYQQILSLDNSNQAAESLLKKIGGAYRALAMENQAKGQFQKGLRNVSKGLMLLPEDKALLAMQNELKTDLESQTRRLAQQARQIKQQRRFQAAERAAMEKRQQTEIQFEMLRLKEVERKLMELQRTMVKKNEESEVKIDMQKTEETEKDTGRRTRLFGTF